MQIPEGNRAPVSAPSGGFGSFRTDCDRTIPAINQTQLLCLLLSYKNPPKVVPGVWDRAGQVTAAG